MMIFEAIIIDPGLSLYRPVAIPFKFELYYSLVKFPIARERNQKVD